MANHPSKPLGSNSNSDPGGKLAKSTLPIDPFQQILAEMDEPSRLQLLRAVQICNANPKDPFMVILLSHATIAQAIVDAPGKIKAAMLEALREGLAMIDHYLQKASELAVQQLRAEIAKSVARLVEDNQSRQEMSGLAPLAIPMLSVCSILLVAAGSVGGWVVSQYQRSPIVTDRPMQLTQRQVDNLRWAETEQGQLAKDIVTWNDGQIIACQKNQTALFQSGDIIVAGYGKVKSGACMLWVVPPSSRQFEPEGKKS
jgi:hypothetical protein